MIKSMAVACFALGSNLIFAGTMGPVCTPGSVTVPCEAKAWDFGVQALYLKPLYGNTDLSAFNIGSGSGTRIFAPLDNDFRWGFRLEGSYHFNTGNDLNVNWLDWRDGNRLRLAPPDGSLAQQPTTTVVTRIYGRAQFDAVNIELGQHVDYGNQKNIRFHGGLQYARATKDSTLGQIVSGATGENIIYNGATSTTDKFKFEGVGPRIGADLSYDFINGFGIYGNAATALLVGNNRYSNNAPFTAISRPVHSSYTGLVPQLEAKVGGKYTYAMSQGLLTLDVGYMVTNYFNAFHKSDLALDTAQEVRQNSDFGLHGPYAGIKWVGFL